MAYDHDKEFRIQGKDTGNASEDFSAGQFDLCCRACFKERSLVKYEAELLVFQYNGISIRWKMLERVLEVGH